jgi:hypothetical protein
VSDEAATSAGGAEVSARPDASASDKPLSITDRLKASLFSAEDAKPEMTAQPAASAEPVGDPDTPVEPKAPALKAKATEEVGDDAPADDAGDEQTEASYETVNDLAEALGWDLEKILDLEAPTKIDGKEGKARLRDIIKSHQLEGHLNQKLMTHADEKKAFETERQNFIQTSQHKLQQLDVGVKMAQKMLEGEFAEVDWQQLQDSDPLEFNQKYVAFQQRQARLNHIAGTLGQERQQSQQAEQAQAQSYLAEQGNLLASKVPEWADSAKREKDIALMAVDINQAYGISEQELRALKDHREVLVLRDAWQWQKLQKSKPALLNKVKTAPKLIKPGAQQSRATQDNFIAQKERERLRTSGKVSDAKAPLKRLLFS